MGNKWVNTPTIYALGIFAIMVPSQALLAFSSYYYVEKLGLGIGLFAVARAVYQIWDAVNQPMAGYLSDRTRTRFGRRKPWIWAAIPLFMLTFIAVFAVPRGLNDHQLFVWLLSSIFVFEAVATVLWVNYGALFPELFRGERLRAKASAVQQGFQITALLVGSAVTPFLYTRLGFAGMSVIYALVFAAFILPFILNVREDADASREPPLPLLQAFRVTLKNREFWIFNIANSFAMTVNGLLSSVIPFYAKYALGIPDSQVSLLLAAVFIPVIPFVAAWYGIVRRLGGRAAWRLAFAVYALSAIPLWFGSNLASGIAAGVVVGFGLAGFLVTPPIIGSRIIDLDAEKTCRRREGIYTAVGGFITRSSGFLTAAAFWIVGLVFGYVSGDNPGPHPELAFRVLACVVPFCLLAISFGVSMMLGDIVDEAKSPKARAVYGGQTVDSELR
jgi:GPH family glycoside/pentoside/hexuronide:cation symporter